VKTVHKFPVIDATLVADVPQSAKVVRFAPQGAMLCAWIEREVGAPNVHRVFRVHGTGHPIEESPFHCASCEDGPFVWHLYEVRLGAEFARLDERGHPVKS
jgi:hypothetical protein